MADLISINPNYALLPLDEPPLEIDANTRQISVPSSFSKCAGVQNDQLCEIITFTVDRYFDYVDLDTAYIAIQYVNAANEEGIHYVRLKDLETYDGKIRFGWPLTADVTKAVGDVHFSVRFFLRENVNAEENPDAAGDGSYQIKYILNTLPAKFPIKAGLNITTPKYEEQNIPNLFASFVRNSINPSGIRPEPIFFVSPGLDLEPYGALNDSDSLTLKAQAVAADTGAITYTWKYRKDDGSIVTITNDTIGYSVNHDFFQKVEWPKDDEGNDIKKRVGSEKYWTLSTAPEGEEGVDWKPEDLGIEAFSLYSKAEFDETTPDLYERFTVLTIEPSATNQVITGQYWVDAVNSVGSNHTNPEASTECNVPAPAQMNIETDLEPHVFLGRDAEGNKVAVLKVVLNKDEAKPIYDYQWYSTTTAEPESFANMNEAANGATPDVTDNENSYAVTSAGWYAVNVDASLNRTSKNMKSKICKVTDLPAAPVITGLDYKVEEAEAWTESDGKASVDVDQGRGDIIRLRIRTDLDEDNGLKSEKMSYTWFVLPVNGTEKRELTAKDIDENGLLATNCLLGTAELLINPFYQGSVDAETGDRKGYTYYCTVTNDIQGKTVSEDIEGFFVY